MSLLCCGNTSDGQLGLGGIAEENVRSLTLVESTKNFLKIRQIACGRHHSVMLLDDGSVFSCGNNDFYQLGHDGIKRKPNLYENLHWYIDVKRLIESFVGIHVISVACGDAHCVALTNDGHLFSWGSNVYGQLGVERMNVVAKARYPRIQEINLANIVQIACGSNHSLALESTDGVLHAWGLNDHGQLGIGTRESFIGPTTVNKLMGIPICQLAAGASHSLVLTPSGTVFGWGKNMFGQIGQNEQRDILYPSLVKLLRTQKVIRLACGEDFSVAVTATGGLFTFGAGTYGQLGHGNQNSELFPKQVMELMGSVVLDVACGRCHTLAITENKLYAFGLNTSGQLGLLNVKHTTSIPLPIPIEKQPRKVFAGADFSFVLCSEPNGDDDGGGDNKAITVPSFPVKHLSLSFVRHLINEEPEHLYDFVETVMTSLCCLNGSFLQSGNDRFGVTERHSCINMDEAMETFLLLSDYCTAHPKVESIMVRSVEVSLIPSLRSSLIDIEFARVYLILPWCHIFSFSKYYRNIVVPFTLCLSDQNSTTWEFLESWWSCLAVRHLNRILKVFKQMACFFIDNLMNEHGWYGQNRNSFPVIAIKSALDVLSHLNKVNVKVRKIPFSSFYIDDLEKKINLRDDFLQTMNEDKQINCWIRLAKVILKLLLLESRKASYHLLVHIKSMFKSVSVLPLSIYIERGGEKYSFSSQRCCGNGDRSSEGIFFHKCFSKQHHRGYFQAAHCCYIVQFVGEDADDLGGLKKEFFMLIFQELFNPKYGMFVEYEESRYTWFAHYNFEEPQTYEYVGILCGMTIYNNVIAALPFPLALYKKLLNEPVTLEDLKELSPTEGRCLEEMLDYDDDDFESVFGVNFQISLPCLDKVETVELKPGGADINVTKANRQEYVDLYVDYKLNQMVLHQFEAFKKGFNRVVAGCIIPMFQPLELMECIIGNQQYDWVAFEKGTQYRGEYWRQDPTIVLFWEVFHEMSLEQKKKFLLFVTGSDRVPFQGMDQIKMIIQPCFGGEEYYPVAHTCFNLIDLPKYKSKEILAKKLLEAIEHNQGFTVV
ncbi:putative E3 ubiquitin-protein ligase HERC4 [Trichinella spiralis]|uniref:Putative E3 ubiquitin-protein ligase HERC4 n=1 Tax=Trichinella spiralis TaxID=6334 RepID=A0A0V1B378_TRISP|nr:putative E3 ubiquitin-protein ligase HERC4 [Trichinella spiralis]